MNSVYENPDMTAVAAFTAETFHRRVSWGAVFAGTVIAVVVQLILSLVGTGIGLSTVDPTHYNSPDASSFGIGVAIWWALSSIIALFSGGWVAGHLAGARAKGDAALHGLVTWGLAAIVAFYLLASALTAVVRGGASAVGGMASATANGVAAAAGPIKGFAKQELQGSGISVDDLKSQVQQLLAQTGKPALQPGALKQQASNDANQLTSTAANVGSNGQPATEDVQSVMQRIIASGADTVGQADREALVNVVVAQTGISQAEAEQRVNGWINTYQQARAKAEQAKAEAEAKARQVAETTAHDSAQASLYAALALVLGAIAAALGGSLAGRRYVILVDNTLPRRRV